MPADRSEYHRAWVAANRERVLQTQREYRARKRDEINAGKRRRRRDDPAGVKDSHLRTRYGITVDDYAAMLEAQGGVCAICSKPPQRRNLSVDHCHSTGAVRGLLCATCNPRLYALENAEWRGSAEAYLAKRR